MSRRREPIAAAVQRIGRILLDLNDTERRAVMAAVNAMLMPPPAKRVHKAKAAPPASE